MREFSFFRTIFMSCILFNLSIYNTVVFALDDETQEHHGSVEIKKEDIELFSIDIIEVGSGEIKKVICVPGEVALNQDLITHIVPRISGIVKSVYVNIGQKVSEGDLLVTLESAELADAKTKYLSSKERMYVNKEIFGFVEKMKKQGVSFSKEYLDAKQQLAEANIQLKNAKQKLLIYGLKEKEIENVNKENISDFMRYKIVSPINGLILDKHITIGEFVNDNSDAMTIVDLNDVWINLSIFQDDMPYVTAGTEVEISPKHNKISKKYKIAYIAPVVDETTRTALARVVAENSENIWRPGEFVRGTIVKEKKTVPLIVPETAIQNLNGEKVVFVEDEDHKGIFYPREIVLGDKDDINVEIKSGLKLGEKIVNNGSFILKAQFSKGSLEEEHSH